MPKWLSRHLPRQAMAVSGCRWVLLLIVGPLLAGVCGECQAAQHIYTVQPMPVIVHPAEGPWGVEVAIQVTDAIHLEIINGGKEPVRILWEDCAYIDVDGRSHRLRTASGEPAAQIPVSVAPGSRVEAVLSPVEDSRSNKNDPLLPGKPERAQPSGLLRRLWPFHRAQAGSQVLGKTITVFLALERNGNRRTVTAAYAITGIRTEHRW